MTLGSSSSGFGQARLAWRAVATVLLAVATALLTWHFTAALPGTEPAKFIAPIRAESSQTVSRAPLQLTRNSAASLASSGKIEVVLLDRSLHELAPALRRQGREVVEFGGANALDQIATLLERRRDIVTLHLISHGETGKLKLDGIPLDSTVIETRYAGALARIGRSLAPHGEILIYGCDIASSAQGRALAATIARLTGSTVAASENPTGAQALHGDWNLEFATGAVRSRPLAMPEWAGQLWTNELYEGGWFGDSNVPTGATGPHAKAGQTGSGRFTTMGDNTGGSGSTFSVVSLSCCTAQKITKATAFTTPTSYATAVSNNFYFYSNVVVGGTNGAALTKFQYNQVPTGSGGTSGAQMQLALYDSVTAALTPISSALTATGSTVSIQVALTPVPMVAGRRYEVRFYFWNCSTCYTDNPQLWTKANEAPTATAESYATSFNTAVSGNVLTNDTDPESQALTVSLVNGAAYTSGSNIALTNGTLNISSNGAFTFTPRSGFYGAQTFTYTASDGFGGTSTATVTIAINQADLSLTKTVNNATPFQGGAVAYTLTVTSNASSTVTATGITVLDALPSGFTFASATGTGTYSSATGVWTVGSLAPGASATMTISGTASGAKGATITNIAQITASSAVDPDSTVNNAVTTEDDYAAVSYTIINPAITITKMSTVVADGVNSSDFKAIPGATVQYCVLVTNTGNTAQTSVTVGDPLPSSLTYITGSMKSGTSCLGATTAEDDNATGTDEADPFGISISGTTITGSGGTLAAGASFAMVYRTRLN